MNGILGSGFGIYGHLPALFLEKTERVCLPIRYRSIIQSRSELQKFLDKIIWCENEEVLLSLVDTLIVSVAPSMQQAWIEKSLCFANIKKLYLEKPLSCSPNDAINTFDNLLRSEKIFRINYSFLYTKWFSELRGYIASSEKTEVVIEWNFFANHYLRNIDTWKRQNTKGGSVLRFYGVHFMPILILLGISEVEMSETKGISSDDCFAWEVIGRKKKIKLHLKINTASQKTSFQIHGRETVLPNTELQIKLGNPFELDISTDSALDYRIGVVNVFYKSLEMRMNDCYYDLYNKSNYLWKQIEEINTFTSEGFE